MNDQRNVAANCRAGKSARVTANRSSAQRKLRRFRALRLGTLRQRPPGRLRGWQPRPAAEREPHAGPAVETLAPSTAAPSRKATSRSAIRHGRMGPVGLHRRHLPLGVVVAGAPLVAVVQAPLRMLGGPAPTDCRRIPAT